MQVIWCISFLLLLCQIITCFIVKTVQMYYHLVLEVRKVQIQSCWAKIRVLPGLYSFWRLQQRLFFFAFSCFQKLSVFLGLPFLFLSLKPEVQHLQIPSLTQLSPASAYKDLHGYTGCTKNSPKINLSISQFNHICKVPLTT